MAEYQLANHTPFYSTGTAPTISGNDVSISVGRSGRVVGFKVPASSIPDYQHASFQFVSPSVAGYTAVAGYWETYTEFIPNFPVVYQPDMIDESGCFVPCVNLTGIRAGTAIFTMPPLVVTYASGKKIYLGPDQVQAVFLGDQEVSNVFLGGDAV